jgi:hypothetical protein
MEELPIYQTKPMPATATATRACTIVVEIKSAQALDRMQQLRNAGVEAVVVRLRDWIVEEKPST